MGALTLRIVIFSALMSFVAAGLALAQTAQRPAASARHPTP
jgi:hypothetical protein